MNFILNCFYLSAGAVALPVWAGRAALSGRHRAGIAQRLGFVPRAASSGARRLWIHTASVGEAALVKNLVPAFLQRRPQWEIVFSCTTNTGRENLAKLYPNFRSFYFPLDFSPCVGLSLERTKPDLIALVELEVWPNFMEGALRRSVPVVIVNGRISDSSARALRGMARLFPRLWDALDACCARSGEDAENFARAGVPEEKIIVTGSLKYDALPALPAPPGEEQYKKLRALLTLKPEARVLLAGSTWPGEEEAMLECFARARTQEPGLRLIIVPRHVERGQEIAGAVLKAGLKPLLKTRLDSGEAKAAGLADEVVIVDTIGELFSFYGLADVVFVGRSLFAPGGGQNMLEPCALGKPVITGPRYDNFKPEMQYLLGRGAVVVAQDAGALYSEIKGLLAQPARAASLGARAAQVVKENIGATGRTLAALESIIAVPRC